GALAASMVGIAEYVIHGSGLGTIKSGALGLEVMLGSLTVTGSLIAAAKLQEVMRGTPIQFKGQHIVNLCLFLAMVTLFVLWLINPDKAVFFYAMAGCAFVFGVLLVISIGSGGMPVVIARVHQTGGLALRSCGF